MKNQYMTVLATVIIILVAGSFKAFSQAENPMIGERMNRIDTVKTILPEQSAGEDEFDVSIFGNGGFKNAVMNTSDENSPLNGSIGVSIMTKKLLYTSLGFTINDIQPLTISSPEAFGAALLTPDVNGQSVTLSLKKFFRPNSSNFDKGSKSNCYNFLKNSGVSLFGLLTKAEWNVGDTGSYGANTFLATLNYIYEPFGIIKKNNNTVVIEVGLGITFRALIGEITDDENISLREENFGTEKTAFWGPDLDLSLIINNQKFFVTVPWIITKETIPGFSGAQVIIGIVLNAQFINFN